MGRNETGETPEKDRNRRRTEEQMRRKGTKEEKKRNESRVETAVRLGCIMLADLAQGRSIHFGPKPATPGTNTLPAPVSSRIILFD